MRNVNRNPTTMATTPLEMVSSPWSFHFTVSTFVPFSTSLMILSSWAMPEAFSRCCLTWSSRVVWT